MEIVGYADRLSVTPGETIRFMISCDSPEYDATIVRLRHGDTNPEGPGFRETQVRTSVDGRYEGLSQEIRSGSYVEIGKKLSLEGAGVTLCAWVYPTMPGGGAQAILAQWSRHDDRGIALVLEEEGDAGLWIGGGDRGRQTVRTNVPLRPREWSFVAMSLDAGRRTALITQIPAKVWPFHDTSAVIERDIELERDATFSDELQMTIAALPQYTGAEGDGVANHFNGKIALPCSWRSRASSEQLGLIARSSSGLAAALPDAIGIWDFSKGIQSNSIIDVSGNGFHGRTVNIPLRGVTGPNWTGEEPCFKHAPQEYGAIYFHEDDLENAGWEVSFELNIDEDLASGVYAAKLTTGTAEDYVPFFIRPRTGQPSSEFAVLLPTLTYMAYANEHGSWMRAEEDGFLDLAGLESVDELHDLLQPQDHYAAENRLLSLYDLHADGSGNAYSSRLRPIVTMRPKRKMALLGCPHGLNADLCLIDWLEEKGIAYDVITDEDLHWNGVHLAKPYKAIATGSHPEYWTAAMLEATKQYIDDGGRLMYLGANGFYWVTGMSPEKPHVIERRHCQAGTRAWESDPGENYLSTTGELGGLWRHRGRPPQALVGVGFAAEGFDWAATGYRRHPRSQDPRSSFILDGVGDEVFGQYGLILGGSAGHELDRIDADLGTPPHTVVVASSFGHSDSYQRVVEEVFHTTATHGGTVSPFVRGDMAFFETENGGAVFSTGSISWCGALSHNGYDNAVSRITENVIRRFLDH